MPLSKCGDCGLDYEPVVPNVPHNGIHAGRAGAVCPECGRLFDLADEAQASEWYYGHDCEVSQ